MQKTTEARMQRLTILNNLVKKSKKKKMSEWEIEKVLRDYIKDHWGFSRNAATDYINNVL